MAWGAFARLHETRVRIPIVRTIDIKQAGMGAVTIIGTDLVPQAISFTDIDVYARRYMIEGTSFEMFLQIITALDTAYLQWEHEKAQERTKAMEK